MPIAICACRHKFPISSSVNIIAWGTRHFLNTVEILLLSIASSLPLSSLTHTPVCVCYS